MKILYKVSTFLILALGIIHVCLTPQFFSSLTQNALWFVSGGLMIVLVSLFNFILMKDAGRVRTIRILCHAANIISLLFASAMFILGSLRARPPASSWLVLLLFVFETVAAFLYRPS
ncbi:MAG: hypothetical protein M3362_20865 [Acidobacteriota bacterium]|nr:hypothetical protein [Acidobacteriota bacterium]